LQESPALLASDKQSVELSRYWSVGLIPNLVAATHQSIATQITVCSQNCIRNSYYLVRVKELFCG
jgi:hypothetical protein